MFHLDLLKSCRNKNTVLCVGIDPTPELVERFVERASNKLLQYCQQVVSSSFAYTCAYKLNHAFFAALGQELTLEKIIQWIHLEFPDCPVILDAKRGDIGISAARSAYEVFERYEADAVTVSPYLGWDSVEPFSKYSDKGVIVLCKTSNKNSAWLQDIGDPNPVYLQVASYVDSVNDQNLMLVVGATHTEALRRVRQVAPEVGLLIPGIGAQGGDAHEVLQIARRSDGFGFVVNCSRGILLQDCEPSEYFARVEETACYYSRLLKVHRGT